jgi:hypothetical protein
MEYQKMPLEKSIPVGDFPCGEHLRSCELSWLGSDTLENYRRNGGHPLYGERDVSYCLNRFGFRCPEFDDPGDIRMVAVGCSVTQGQGLPQRALFHERLAERLRLELSRSVVNWNLGVGGGSNDLIARVLCLALPLLDPDIVVVNFTSLERREYYTPANDRMRFIPAAFPPSLRETQQHFLALTSQADDQANLLRNYQWIEALLHGRTWYFSFGYFEPKMKRQRVVQPHLDPARHVESPPIMDQARDGLHAGARSHEQLYRNYWLKLQETGALDRLQAGRCR